ncbi:MAG: hypothetical protein NWF06_04625, partial [Candidatus Bathyarchaeota archaeon]|nr:hypothetical protein [Candidatus Bathyarchaeum sp.]
MKKTKKYQTKIATIALTLILTISTILIVLPAIYAHEPPWTIPTYSYLVISPDPIGVGQDAVVVMWVHPNPPTASGIGGDRWRDITLTITAPNGDKEVLGPWYSDSTGSLWTMYTPTQIGTYEFFMDYPGQVMSWYGPTGLPPGDPSYLSGRGQDVYLNDTFTGSNATAILTVTDEPVEKIPDYPLPTEYWTRPIEGQNTAWATISSNWLAGSHIVSRFQKDGVGPNSAHILWTTPLEFGGVVGGTFDIPGVAYYSGGSYETRFSNTIIMQGRLYYRAPLSHSGSGGDYICVDLLTGEEIWRRDDIAPTFGQLYDYESRNQHGVVGGLLWQTSGNKWIGIDAFSGENAYNFTGIPSGTQVYTNMGEIERYVLNYADRELSLWSTAATNASVLVSVPGVSTSAYQYRTVGKEIDLSGESQYLWTVTIPDLPGDANPSITKVIPGDLILGTSSSWPDFRKSGTPDPYTIWAINLDETRGDVGDLLWIKDYPAPDGFRTYRLDGDHIDVENRVFMMSDDETFQWTAWSLDTGDLVWGPVGEDFNSFQYYGDVMFRAQTGYVAYGNIYVQGYGGELRCYDCSDGTLLWTYDNTYAGFENPWGNYPIFIGAIADGKIYTFNHEHSPNTPLYKGNRMRCVDAFTGDEVWTLMGWTESLVLADGCVVYRNYYDNQIYVIGKGSSETTVSASPKVITVGSSVLIEGSVIDTSAGTQQNEQAARFPHGVPAMSDADMGLWMEYVYMQKPIPGDAKGVTVTLTAIDPNGNAQNIGTTTTDLNGNFGVSWVPPVPGDYQITAYFGGSNSYWPSYDTGYLVVDPSSSQATPIEPEEPETPTQPEEPEEPETPT